MSSSVAARALVALITLHGVTGCGAVDSATSEAERALDDAAEAAGSRNIEGTLPMRWESADGQSGPMRFVLVQDGLSVQGVAVFEGHPCLNELSVDAGLEITGIKGNLLLDDAKLPFELTLFDQSGPKPSPAGVLRGADTLLCLAKDGVVRLESR